MDTGFRGNCALTPVGAADCWGYNHWGEDEDLPVDGADPRPEYRVRAQDFDISLRMLGHEFAWPLLHARQIH